MKFIKDMTGAASLIRSFKIGATVIAGQVVMLDTNKYGEITDCSTTAALNAFGVTLGAGTYTTTQGTGSSSANKEVEVLANPLGVFEAKASGAAAAGTALTTANIITNSTANTAGTTVSSSTVSANDFTGGMCCGLSGANKNATRIMTTDTSATSFVVTVPFDYTIAASDKFLRVPWSTAIVAVQLCTELNEADATIASSTGVPANIYKVRFETKDETYPEVYVSFALRTHHFNSLA